MFRRSRGLRPRNPSTTRGWEGLLEHSLSLARGAMALAANYPDMNRDLLLCACFFHDVGKTLEIRAIWASSTRRTESSWGTYTWAPAWSRSCAMESRASLMKKAAHRPHRAQPRGGALAGIRERRRSVHAEAIFFHHLDNLDAKVRTA